MNIKEARELLDCLDKTSPDVDLRVSIDKIELINTLKSAKFHVVLESNAWRKAELSICCKTLERNHV